MLCGHSIASSNITAGKCPSTQMYSEIALVISIACGSEHGRTLPLPSGRGPSVTSQAVDQIMNEPSHRDQSTPFRSLYLSLSRLPSPSATSTDTMAAVSNSMTQNMSYKAQLTAHQSLRTAQATAFLLPPAYLIYSIGKGQGLYVRKWMGFSIASALAGAALGVGIGYARNSSTSDIDAAAQVQLLVSLLQAVRSARTS